MISVLGILLARFSILGPANSQNCSQGESVPLPSLQILSSNEDPLLSLINSSITLATIEEAKFKFVCSAPYPIKFNYYDNVDNLDSFAELEDEEAKTVKINQSFTCQSLNNFCQSQTILFSFNAERDEIIFNMEWQPTNNNSSFLTPIWNPQDDEICPVLFYYEKIENEFPTFRFHCNFSDGSPGVIDGYDCSSNQECQRILSKLYQIPTHCFKMVNETCGNCGTKTLQSFISFDAICRKNEEKLNPVKFGGPVYFGFAQEIGQRPNIFFSDKDLVPGEMIEIDKFERVQLKDTKLYVKCSSSYYVAAESFQFALEFMNNISLHFLPVFNSTEYDTKLNTVTQIYPVLLDSTEITKIHCFGLRHDGQDQLHVSKHVTVLEPRDYLKPSRFLQCNKTLDRKLTMELKYENKIRQVPFLTSLNVIKPVNGEVIIEIICKSSHPVSLLQEENYYQDEDKPIAQDWDFFRTFTNFDDISTYTFTTKYEYKFKNVVTNKLFKCQNNLDPCQFESIQYSFNSVTLQLQFSSISDIDSSQTNLIEDGQLNNWNNTECETIIYYEIMKDGFNLYCQFPFQIPGSIVKGTCSSLVDCPRIFKIRQQPKKCIQPYKQGTTCRDCTVNYSDNFSSTWVTCGHMIHGQIDRYETAGNLIYFDIPFPEKPPNAYTSLEHLIPSRMITMTPVDPEQIIGSKLDITCTTSVFYTAQQIYMAVKYREKNQLVFLPGGSDNIGNYISKTHTYSVTTQVYLGETTIEKIICLAGVLTSHQWVNISYPVSVVVPIKPTIYVGAEQFNSSETEKNSFKKMKKQDTKINLQLNSINQSVFCMAEGIPLPKISWTIRNLGYEPRIVHQIFNSSHVSHLQFDKIDQNVLGTYICQGTSKAGIVMANMFIDVTSTDLNNNTEAKGSIPLIISVTCPLVAIIIIIGIVMICMWRRTRKLTLQIRNLTPEEIHNFIHGDLNCNSNTANSSIYSLPFNQNYEIPRDKLKFGEDLLGSGAYGVVRKGYILNNGGKEMVAIKTMKNNTNTLQFLEMLSEIKIMAYIGHHQNILNLKATCTANIELNEALAVVEFCGRGDLLNYLKKNRTNFNSLIYKATNGTSDYENEAFEMQNKNLKDDSVLSTLSLILIARGIANGMNYLTLKNVIHGDLAARNILLTDDMTVKISDFGLSRQLQDSSNYVKKTKAALPWKWLAVESLKNHVFSVKSDVWSYGIVLWELFSLGESPYPGCRWTVEFVYTLEQGYRMSKPDHADDTIYQLMTQCWNLEPSKRPTFTQLLFKINDSLSKFST